MKKKIVFIFLVAVSILGLKAQEISDFTSPQQRFNTGKELYDLGKYAASQRYFEEYLKVAQPTDAGAIQEAEYYVAAIDYHFRTVNAEEKLNYFVQKHPYSPFADQVKFMLANLMVEQEKYSKALNYLRDVNERALRKHDLAEKLFIEGYSYLQTKNYTRASHSFRQLREMDTRYNMVADYYYAYTAYIEGNFDEALPIFLNLEVAPQFEEIIPYYIIQIYYSKGEYNEVMQRADKLLDAAPDNTNNAEIYRIVGEIAYQQKDYSKAIYSLEMYESLSNEVLRNDIYLLGLSYYQLKDYSTAIQYLSRITTKRDEITENAYLHIGNSYVALNDIANARLAYEAALDTQFDSSVREVVLYNYALTTYETNSAFGESISAFEKFLAEYPNSSYADKAYDYLSSVYMTSQNYKAAYQSIQKIKNPTSQIIAAKQYVLNQLGIEEFARKNYLAAANNFTDALESTVNKEYEADSYIWRAESNYRLAKYQQTLQDLNKFFALTSSKSNPNSINANYLAGYTYFSLKDYNKALDYFRKYETLSTNNKDAVYADAMNRMGDCYFNARNFDEAIKSYNKSINASNAYGDYALFQIGYANGLQKKYTTKIMTMERVVKEYTNSQYADDAVYEIGRAYLMLENGEKAIDSYQRLLNSYPNSPLAPKAALEIGMVYMNQNSLDNAINAYKVVVQKYPGSEEARTALRSMEGAYIEVNDVSSYFEFAKNLGSALPNDISSKEDSIAFIAAERQYMYENYHEAIIGLTDYLSKYCDGGQYCTTALYYLADSYYQTDNKDAALTEFEKLANIAGNKNMEEAVLRSAEITYDKELYDKSLEYFSRLQEIASNPENKNIGRLGVLRSSYFLNNHQTTINIASEIIDEAQTDEEIKLEARYNRAKAYIALGDIKKAIPDLHIISENTNTKNGAESKYLLAQIYFNNNDLDEAEQEIMDFAQKRTSSQNLYWLARSHVLLSDIYILRNDDFQAKQYLLSLQKNYTEKDDIQVMILHRLEEINTREQENIIN